MEGLNKNCKFKMTESVKEAVAYGARDKLREVQLLFKAGGEAMPASAIKVIEQS